ncbi:MAG: ABC transporter permease subunit [Lachnospiraceae bacterium]
MKSILKSQLYQMKLPYIWKKVLPILLVFNFLIIYVNVVLGGEIESLSEFIVGGEYGNLLNFMEFFIIIATAEICGNDFSDKTINHELLSGHSRKDVFLGRAVAAIGVSLIGALILLVIPIVAFTAMGYWGDTVTLKGVVLRIALCIFPIIKVSCEMILLTYIVKNGLLASVIGCVGLIITGVIGGMTAIGMPYLISSSNLMQLFHFDGWSTYRMKDLKQFSTYESMVNSNVAILTVVVSVLAGAMFLWIGYKFFEKDDLK